MGENGMGGMHEMHGTLTGNGMKFPANSIPMLGGDGPFGAIEMGGMFTIVKVRPPGHLDDIWYQHPAGTVASAATAEELRRDGIEAPTD